MLEHLRSLRCLPRFRRSSVDPDVFFRSLGGEELVPPGGVDAFVGDVMSQVRVRDAESRDRAAARRERVAALWPIAATVAAGVTGATLAYRYEHRPVATAGARRRSAAQAAADQADRDEIVRRNVFIP